MQGARVEILANKIVQESHEKLHNNAMFKLLQIHTNPLIFIPSRAVYRRKHLHNEGEDCSSWVEQIEFPDLGQQNRGEDERIEEETLHWVQNQGQCGWPILAC